MVTAFASIGFKGGMTGKFMSTSWCGAVVDDSADHGEALGVGYGRFSTDRQNSLKDQHQVNDRIANAHDVTLAP